MAKKIPSGRKPLLWIISFFVLSAMSTGCGEATQGGEDNGISSLIFVSPHQDDETIIAGGMLARAARDLGTRIEILYVTAGDGLLFPGPCREESEEERKRKIMELREEEARAACQALGIPSSRLHFLRYPNQGLVKESAYENGQRVDVLTEVGERAVSHVVDLLPRLVPPNAENLLMITASFWDAHGDHRITYRAARTAAEVVRAQRDIPVTLLHSIVHDEVPFPFPVCCLGDIHWPNLGPHLDHAALMDFPERPRPPFWDVVVNVEDFVQVRSDALKLHKSQVEGYPELCMTVFLQNYLPAWMNKEEEAFWEEIL